MITASAIGTNSAEMTVSAIIAIAVTSDFAIRPPPRLGNFNDSNHPAADTAMTAPAA